VLKSLFFLFVDCLDTNSAIFSNDPIKGPARSPGRKESGRQSTQTSWPSDFACGVQGFAASIGKFGK